LLLKQEINISPTKKKNQALFIVSFCAARLPVAGKPYDALQKRCNYSTVIFALQGFYKKEFHLVCRSLIVNHYA